MAVGGDAGVLMVSNIRYRSFKDLNLRGRVRFVTILVMPLVLVLIVLDPPQILFIVSLTYALSGPAASALGRLRHPTRKPADR